MFSKEEIEDIIESKFNNSEEENFGLTVGEAKHIALYEKEIHYCDALTQATYNILLQYIKQLETKEQKLIEKLETDKNNLEFSRDLDADKGFGEDEEDMAVRAYIEEILELVKGENNEQSR